jgi:uncharacterized repeat protein (TIGR04076 family)
MLKKPWEGCNWIKVKVLEVKGVCGAGHKEGEEWIVQRFTPADFCGSAYCSIYPDLRALAFGGKIPWEKNGQVKVGCSDCTNTVIFGLERLSE